MIAISKFRRPAVGFAAWLLGAMLLAVAPASTACDTPVYRYAMYRWEAAPYEVYYFHRGEIDEATAQLHRRFEQVKQSSEQPANVLLFSVNLDEDPELESVPAAVRAAWQTQREPVPPTHLVVGPHRAPIHTGLLDETELNNVLDSPARRQLAKLLEAGNATVLTWLTGSDESANAEAEKLLAKITKEVIDGKLELYTPSPGGGIFGGGQFGGPPPAAAEPDQPPVRIARLKVDRDDPAEKWLVEMLLSLEPDLKDQQFENVPMVFGVYGRGRALPPFIGKGIAYENLLDCVYFVTSACSCTVKDQNPGLDLLISQNWELAAERIAAMFGAEEGNETSFSTADFFSELSLRPESSDEVRAAGGGQPALDDAVAVAANPPAGDQALTAAATNSDAPEATGRNQAEKTTAGEPIENAPPMDRASPSQTVRQSHAEGSSSHGEQSPAMVSVFSVATVVGIALVLLFGLTFFVLRPR